MTVLQAENATVICQRALGWAEHRNTFDSLEDGSQLAGDCRLRYDARRRAVLEALDWGFARRRQAGTSVTVTAAPVNLPHAWQRPQDCIRIRGVLVDGKPVRQRIEEVIFTEEHDAVQLVFTADKTNPALFAPAFTTAFEFLLASEFSMVFARSANRAEIMLQNFRRAMDEADAMEAREWGEDEAYASGSWVDAIEYPWLDGRHG
jgi:hypothetical protein